MKRKLAVDNIVRYTKLFLQSTGQHTGKAPFRRGYITKLEDIGGTTYATVKWQDGPGMVNTFNIEQVP